MKVYWQQENNVGDKLTPYILKNLFGITAKFSRKKGKLLGVGSILSHAKVGDTIWGSGLISPHHLPQSADLNVLAVRGPLTRDILSKMGVKCNDCILGDPALLLPQICKPIVEIRYEKGIIPHYVDYDFVKKEYASDEKAGKVKIIDVRLPIEDFITSVLECEEILSSSLHGLIIADAYGKGNMRVKFSNKLIGGDFKFIDYEKSKGMVDTEGLLSELNSYIVKNG